jgi:hypothetical protein
MAVDQVAAVEAHQAVAFSDSSGFGVLRLRPGSQPTVVARFPTRRHTLGGWPEHQKAHGFLGIFCVFGSKTQIPLFGF